MKKNTMTVVQLVVVAALMGSLTTFAASQRPNVLFISCDDLNVDLSIYGHSQVKSPNIDRLAARGTRFTNAYAQWPGCMPSRYSFLSGWTCPRIGIKKFDFKSRTGELKNAMYLPQWFKEKGYTTVRIDKVFHPSGDDPASWNISEEPTMLTGGQMLVNWLGIEVQSLGLDGVHDYQFEGMDEPANPTLEKGSFDAVAGEKGPYYIMRDEVPEEMLFDGNTAKRGKMYLEQFAESGEPFFLALGFRRPHVPFIAQKRYFDLYPWESIKLPPAQPGFEKPFSDEDHKKLIRGYYAAVSFVDAQVGKVLDTLEKTGLADNTIVVLIGDHGYALGERDGWFSKGRMWDSALRTTCIVAAPGAVKKNAAVDAVVGLTDLYPTIVDLAGLDRPDIPLDGKSLVNLLQGDCTDWRNNAISHNYRTEWDRVGGTIRTEKWRYIECGDNTVELYDVANDPWEWNNLAKDPAYADVIKELSTQVAASFEQN